MTAHHKQEVRLKGETPWISNLAPPRPFPPTATEFDHRLPRTEAEWFVYEEILRARAQRKKAVR